MGPVREVVKATEVRGSAAHDTPIIGSWSPKHPTPEVRSGVRYAVDNSVSTAPAARSSADVTGPRVAKSQLGWRSWLGILDGIGLALAWGLMVSRLDFATADHRVFALLLLINSLYLWHAVSQRRTLDTILRRTRQESYAVPTLAAGITWVLLLLLPISSPLFELGLFAMLWTVGMLGGRALLRRRLPPLQVLLVGSPAFASELVPLPGVEIRCATEPPQRFNGWDVVVTDPVEHYDPEWSQWMDHADLYGIKVLSAPLVLEALTRRVPFEMLNGRWAFQVLEGQSRYLVWKRAFDVAAIVLLSPLILLVAALVALIVLVDSGRPIFFWQERVGLRGKTFMMIKFRTMRADAEFNGSAFATHADPRITKVGHFLRKFRLDEVPQLWNVLVGDMSIIGPRPEQKGFAGQFADEIPLYGLRHNLRPGITGWAQVMQGYADDTLGTKLKLRHDFYYVRRCSFALDFRIVLETLRTIATGFGSR